MRNRHLISWLLVASLALTSGTSILQPDSTHAKSQLFTIVVQHEECTECGDLEIESGEVVVPVALRERYLQAFANSPRSGMGDYSDRYGRTLARCEARGWRVGNVKLESDKDFENLFLLPGKKPSNSYGPEDNPWDFNRRYRATVEVVGIKWSYLTVRVRKAVRLADSRD